jgi:hypothetical protein
MFGIDVARVVDRDALDAAEYSGHSLRCWPELSALRRRAYGL